MSLFDEQDESQAQPLVNVYEYYRSHGLSDLVATQLVFHLLLTRAAAFESDARECALELNIPLPFIFPGDGLTH